MISAKISPKYVPKGPINNIPALVQIMAWCRPGDKPISEPMMVRLPKHICVTRPQWVNKFRPVENIFNHILLNTFYLSIQTSLISFPQGPLSTFSISQHCFMWWLGAWWQQTITWNIVGQDVWHHTASLGLTLSMFNLLLEKYAYIEGTRRVDGNANILSHPGP